MVTRSSGQLSQIAKLGAATREFDYRRSSLNPMREAWSVAKLKRLLREEKPDVVHLVAMKPIMLGCLALDGKRHPKLVVHLTGLGFLGISQSLSARLLRPLGLKLLAARLGKPGTWLLAENSDDVAFLQAGGLKAQTRLTILGGAGIDESRFTPLPPPHGPTIVAAYAGRMIRPKGVDVLMAAGHLLRVRNAPVAIELCGQTDAGNPEAVQASALRDWCEDTGAKWNGHIADIRELWRRADVFVLPARSREGMPRAILEAAACGRPLIVTDVPGCRHFVRNGIEGFVVPPENPTALADAIERLARDAELRHRMGTPPERGYSKASPNSTCATR